MIKNKIKAAYEAYLRSRFDHAKLMAYDALEQATNYAVRLCDSEKLDIVYRLRSEGVEI